MVDLERLGALLRAIENLSSQPEVSAGELTEVMDAIKETLRFVEGVYDNRRPTPAEMAKMKPVLSDP